MIFKHISHNWTATSICQPMQFFILGKKKKGDDKSGDGDTESEASQRSETEEILDSILPPREWEEHGQLWRQSVSSTPATRLDVINLQEQLDQKLEQRQARETGICQVRRELYAQCFDELIRQVGFTNYIDKLG